MGSFPYKADEKRKEGLKQALFRLPIHSCAKMAELDENFLIASGAAVFFFILFITSMIIGEALFGGCYSYGKLKYHMKVDWNSRIVSNIHTGVALIGAIHSLYYDSL